MEKQKPLDDHDKTNFIGDTAIRDRSGMASAYSDVVDGQMPPSAKANLHTPASARLEDILVVVFGLVASTCLPLFVLVSQNVWFATAASIAFAFFALALAYKNYLNGNGITPLTVVGLAAAAISISNAISAQIVARVFEATLR